MSTAVTAESAPAEPRSALQRVPTPLFVIGYGALLVAVVLLIAMLVSYRADATPTEAEPQDPRQAWNPAPMDVDNVRASVRDYLITDVETGVSTTGVTLRGQATEYAVTDVADFTGHLSRLMEQNCLDTLVLTTPDNMRLEFLGFCFSTLPQPTIAAFTELALEEDADSVAFVNYNSEAGTEIALSWLNVPSTAKLDRLEAKWEKISRPAAVNRLKFSAYTPDRVLEREMEKGKGTVIKRGPATTSE